MSRRGRDGDLDVEELDVGAWGRPGADWIHPVVDQPPGAPPAAGPLGPAWTTMTDRGASGPAPQAGGSWWQRHSSHAIAAAGGFALLIAVVAVASGPGGDPSAAPTTPPTTAAPPTTAGRPVEPAAPSTTAPPERPSGGFGDGDAAGPDAVDYRFALRTIPDGFEATGAELIDEPDEFDGWVRPAGPTLFAADGTTWQSGPWLTITSSNDRIGAAFVFPFTRPPAAYTIGDADARTGTSIDGVEVTTLGRGATVVEIAARGLDALATAAVAQALQLTDDGIAVPDTAIPVGLRPRPDIDVTTWHYYGGWSPAQRASVSYGSIDQTAWMTFGAWPRDEAADLLAAAPYFLSDLRYLVVGSGSGIAGTFHRSDGDPAHYVIWQLADRDYVSTATGIELDELIGHAASVIQQGDPEWRSSRWDDLSDDARDCCQQQPGSSSVLIEVPVTSAEDFEWQGDAVVQAGVLYWNFARGGPSGDAFGMQSPLGAPMLRVGSRYGSHGVPEEFPAAAVALVDRSMTGAVLRLSMTGTEPQTIEVPLQPLDHEGLSPYLAGAVVLPWIDGGFVAQLIAPGGQTIAVQTDADLP